MDWKYKLIVSLGGAIIFFAIGFLLGADDVFHLVGLSYLIIMAAAIFFTIDRTKGKAFTISFLISLIPLVYMLWVILQGNEGALYALLTVPFQIGLSLVQALLITFV